MSKRHSEIAIQSIAGNTIRGIVHLTTSTAATSILRLIVVGVMARLLSPDDFGVVAVANIFVEFARMIAATGVSHSVVQIKDLTNNQIRTAFASSISIGLFAMVAVMIASPFIAKFFMLPNLRQVLLVSSVIPPIMAVSAISSKLLEREQNFKPMAKSNVIAYIMAQVLIGIPMALLGYGYWSLIIPQIAGAAIQSIMLVYAQPHAFSIYFGLSEYKSLMRLGTGFGIQEFANFLAQRGDYFVVGKALGPTELGRYERSYVLMNLSNSLLANMLNVVLFPAFAKLSDDTHRFKRAYIRCMQITGLITIPVSCISVVLSKEIVETLLGQRWVDAATPFAILAGGIFARTCYKVAGSAGNGLGLAYQIAFSQILYAVFVIGGAAVGSIWGINGVAVSTLISIIVVFASLNHTVLRHVGLSWLNLIRAFLPGFFTAVIVGFVTFLMIYFLRTEFTIPAVLRLMIAMLINLVVFVISIVAAPHIFLGKEILEMVSDKVPKTGIGSHVGSYILRNHR